MLCVKSNSLQGRELLLCSICSYVSLSMIIVRVTQNNATIEQCFRKLIYLHSYLDIKSMISTVLLLKFSIMNYYRSNVVLVCHFIV